MNEVVSSQSLNKYKEKLNEYLVAEDHYAAYDLINKKIVNFNVELDSFQYLAGISAFHLNAFSKAGRTVPKNSKMRFIV